MVVVMAMISTLGTFAMDAQIYTQTIVRFAYALAISIGSATQIKTGYYVGARQSEIAYKKVYKYWLCAVMCSMSLMLVCNLLKVPLAKIFTTNTDVIQLIYDLLLVSFYIELCAFVALVFIVGGILLQGAWAAGEGSCRGDFISGVPLHFIPGQAAPDSAFASLILSAIVVLAFELFLLLISDIFFFPFIIILCGSSPYYYFSSIVWR